MTVLHAMDSRSADRDWRAYRRIRRVRAIGLPLTFSHDVAVSGQLLQASGGPIR